MTKKKEFLAKIVKESAINIYATCEYNTTGDCKNKCPLYKIKGNCHDALQVYIKRLRGVDRLEFLVAIQ